MQPKKVKHMTCDTKLQEAIEEGAQEQWHHDFKRTVDILTSTTPEHPIFWGDITVEQLDTREVKKARAMEIGYFK